MSLLELCLEEMSAGNYSRIIQEILLGNVPLNTRDDRGYTVFHLLAWKNMTEKVVLLLDEADCPVDLPSSTGQTALHLACMKDCVETIKVLLDRGADINRPCKVMFTPILTALKNNCPNSFVVLLSRGANIHAKDTSGCSVLHWAAYLNNL
jgi:ankyrin repeat protein